MTCNNFCISLSKINKVLRGQLKGIFTELVYDKNGVNKFYQFLGRGRRIKLNSIKINSNLGKLRRELYGTLMESCIEYEKLIEDDQSKLLFNKLAQLETRIIQLRCVVDTKEIKFSRGFQKKGVSETEFLIARAPFYIPNQVRSEIRVYIGKIHELGDVERKLKDKDFLNEVEEIVVQAMIDRQLEERGAITFNKRIIK